MQQITFAKRLYVRISSVICLISLLISGIASYISYQANLNQIQNVNVALVQQLAESVTSTAAIAAYVNDEELADEITKGLVSNDLVSSASLTKSNAMNVLNGTTDYSGTPVIVALLDPFNQEEQIGVLRVYPDTLFIKQGAIFTARQNVFLLMGLSIIIAIISSVFIHRLLTHPLHNLTRSVDSVNLHSPENMESINIHYRRKDELARLLFGINALITALKSKFIEERSLREKTEALEKRFRLIFEQASAGIAVIDNTMQVITFNQAFRNLMEYKPNISCSLTELFVNESEFTEGLNEVLDVSTEEQVWKDLVVMRNGEMRYVHCLFSAIIDERESVRQDGEKLIQLIIYDITDRMRRERKIRYEADHDALTQLKNRRAGEKGLSQLCIETLSNKGTFILMMIDLDKFKPVNDTYGHDVGDEVLREVSVRIRYYFDEQSDMCVRWGGDEFVIGFDHQELDKKEVTALAENLLSDLNAPFDIEDGPTCHIGASIGIVTAPFNASSFEQLMIKADEAMYYAKNNGRNQVYFLSDS